MENPRFDIRIHELKYEKQFSRLVVEHGVLYREFVDEVGKTIHKQYCASKHLREEVIYRQQNAARGGQSVMTRTFEAFREIFYFPGFGKYYQTD